MEPWSADGFRGSSSADNPFGIREYRNVIGNQPKELNGFKNYVFLSHNGTK